jgi:hypothetical protein
MTSKLAGALDSIADRLEAKGLIKEALELDKVADDLDDPIYNNPKFIGKFNVRTWSNGKPVESDLPKFARECIDKKHDTKTESVSSSMFGGRRRVTCDKCGYIYDYFIQ